MDRIFRGARQVIAWLGDHLPHHIISSTYHEEIEESLAALHRTSLSGQDLRTFASRPAYEGHGRTIKDAFLRLYTSFASNTYWQRLWIVQVLVLAPGFSLWCDRLRLTSYQLSALMSTVEEAFPRLKESDPNHPPEASLHLWAFRMKAPRSSVTKSSFKEMETLRDIVHIGGLGNTVLISTVFRWRRDHRSNDSPTHACSLLHAITSTAILDCSVVHDHIFSIVGLTSSIMTTDYSTPILKLYLRTLAETLVDLSRDNPASEASIKDFDNPLLRFDRLRADVRFRIVNERLERKVRKDANLTEAGEGGRTMPCSAWIELTRRVAREVREAKNRQTEDRVARSETDVQEAENPRDLPPKKLLKIHPPTYLSKS